MSTLKANRIQQVDNDNLPVNLLPVTASAWVNFNGAGTVAIRDSQNVSSITDLGIGDYTVNFSSALSDVNYSAVSSTTSDGGALVRVLTTTGFNTQTFTSDGTNADFDLVCSIVFGGQS